MKLAFIALSCFVIGSHGLAIDLSVLSGPCDLGDQPCIANQVKALLPVITKLLGDPLPIPKLVIPKGCGVYQVDEVLENVKVEGLSALDVKDVCVDLDTGTITIIGSAKEVKLVIGKYNFNGRCLLFPIYGQGNGEVTLKDVTLTFTLTIDVNQLESISLCDVALDVVAGDLCIKLSSLYNEKDVLILTPIVEEALNKNALQVFCEVKPQYVIEVSKVLKTLLAPILKLISLGLIFNLPC